MSVLARRGVPNYFGPQRFGMRGDTWEVGRPLVAADFASAVALIVGRPAAGDPASVGQARALAAAGQYWRGCQCLADEVSRIPRVCAAHCRTDGDPQRAIFTLDRSVLGFYVSAYQAWLFNRVLAERLTGLDRLLPGDIAFSHQTGLYALVADASAEQARAARFEVSPTGPIAGFAMTTPQDEAAVIERTVLAEIAAMLNDLPRSGPLRCVGGRRSSPIFLGRGRHVESGADQAGAYLELRFTLPPGCYATAVLREICKDQLRDGPADPGRCVSAERIELACSPATCHDMEAFALGRPAGTGGEASPTVEPFGCPTAKTLPAPNPRLCGYSR